MAETDEITDRRERFADYASARLWVHDVRDRVLELRPAPLGAPHVAFPFDAPAAHIITAFNPGTERPSAADNEERQRELVAELPGSVSTWSAEAGSADGAHRETSVLVLGLRDEDAVGIGARWGQDAVFRWTPEAWSVLPCDGSPATDAGWRLVEHRLPLRPGTSMRRRVHRPNGGAETWTVAGGPDVWTVRGGDEPQEVRGSLREVIAGTPELRDLHPGTASEFDLADGALEPAGLAALLRVVGDDAEDPSAWPEADADRWHVEDGDEMVDGLEWRHRWVEINGDRASAVVVPGRDELQLVVSEDEDHLAVTELIAEFDWSSDGGGRPMSTDGGNSLGRLAPGLLYQRRWGDFGPEHHLVPVDDGSTSMARALADWVEWAEVEQSLALTQEPLDPARSLSDDERERIARALALCEISLTFPDDEVGRLAREQVAAGSEAYRRTRDALASPGSENGRALRALLAAVEEGEDVPDSVTRATWQ